MKELWVLVPLKRLVDAKQRLAPALDAESRRELVVSMAVDVLDALVQVEVVERVLLVSEDSEVEQFALDAGIEWYRVSPGDGLNEDLECAAAFAWEQGAGQVLIVHADLPFLRPAPLRDFIADKPGQMTRLAGCKGGTGTNLLLTPLPLSFPLVYGSDSLTQFQRLLGEMAQVVQDAALSMDIDNPGDLNCLLMDEANGASAGLRTRAWADKYGHVLQALPVNAPHSDRQDTDYIEE